MSPTSDNGKKSAPDRRRAGFATGQLGALPRPVAAVLTGLAAALVALAIRQWVMGAWFDAAERLNYDDLIRQHAKYRPCPNPSRVVIIAIDPRSEKELGSAFPWTRDYHAQLIRELKQLHFKVIAFDVIFDRPSGNKAFDRELAQAAGEAGNVVWQSAYPDHPGESLKVPIPVLRAAAGSRTGFANVDEDVDQIARSIPAIFHSGGETIHPLPIMVVDAYEDGVLHPEVRGGMLRTARFTIPLDVRGHFPIRYLGPAHPLGPAPGEIPHLSCVDVLKHRVSGDYSGKIALIGRWDQLDPLFSQDSERDLCCVDLHQTPYTAVANLADRFHDVGADPLRGQMFGVEIMAQAVLAILDRVFILPASFWWTAIAAAVLAILSSLLTAYGKPLLVLPLIFVMVAGFWVAAMTLFVHASIWIEIYVVPFAAILGFVGMVVEREVLENRERRKTLALFSRYVAPSVARRLLNDPESAALGSGRLLDVTVLFCDIRSFASWSEKLFPEQVLSWLSAHMEIMVNAIHAEDGTVDKYMGDGVMAVFGAPEAQTDHAARAVRSALAMSRAMDELNTARVANGQWVYNIGIGMHTGPVVAGSMGARSRPEYTVIGDTVNTAYRLEPLCKDYHCRILVSRETLEASGQDPEDAEYVGTVPVRGRIHPVEIFKLR